MGAIFTTYDLRLVKETSGRYELDKMVKSAFEAAQVFMELFELEQLPYEQLVMLALDTRNRVIGCFRVSQGTIDEAVASPREVATRALLSNAVGVILGHNHPSGNASPSTNDIITTKAIKKALSTVGVKLIDHVVVGRDSYASIASYL